MLALFKLRKCVLATDGEVKSLDLSLEGYRCYRSPNYGDLLLKLALMAIFNSQKCLLLHRLEVLLDFQDGYE